MKFAEIIILKRLGSWAKGSLTYQIPSKLLASKGDFVRVKIGNATCNGILISIGGMPPEGLNIEKIKPILSVHKELSLSKVQMDLFEFIIKYYYSSPYKTLSLFMPRLISKKEINPPHINSYQLMKELTPRGARQLDIINYLKQNGTSTESNLKNKIKNFSAPALKVLIKKQIVEHKTELKYKEFDVKRYKFPEFKNQLTNKQKQIINEIDQSNKPVLLHGVTGSGKTEVYLRLIIESIKKGKSALLLLPEIALTPQMIKYFKYYLGDHIAVFHSKLTNQKRTEQWWRVKAGEAKLIIGSRSAVFSPIKDLDLIILDEEHEWTYKQESNPYYETHKVAEFIAKKTEAKLVFGTATPRGETYHKAKIGGYTYLEMPERVHQGDLPEIKMVDLRDEFKKKNFSIFSLSLQNKIKDRLAKGEQIILFVNQRGAANAVVCRDCGYKEECPHCDISLKYHRYFEGKKDLLVCHYCFYTKPINLSCPSCQSVYIKHIGVGTQRVEKEMKELFPSAKTIRADQDSIKEMDFNQVYHEFLDKKHDVLIGTQMVAKGLDFSNVSLIGIILADIGLHVPDFRSSERLFQILTQVAGRCGRGETIGEVILQTYNPDHPTFKKVANYDYKNFIEEELKFREKLSYPPFNKMIKFTVVGNNQTELSRLIQHEKETLEDLFKIHNIELKLTSAPALIPKIANKFYYQVLLRSKNPDEILNYWKPPNNWRIDVDPIHT